MTPICAILTQSNPLFVVGCFERTPLSVRLRYVRSKSNHSRHSRLPKYNSSGARDLSPVRTICLIAKNAGHIAHLAAGTGVSAQ